MEKGICIIGAGKESIQIAVKKAMSIHGECFIRLHNDEFEIIDPVRILTSDKQNDVVTIMKGVQCGKTESIFNNWNYDRIERNIKKQFVADYVKESLMEFRL